MDCGIAMSEEREPYHHAGEDRAADPDIPADLRQRIELEFCDRVLQSASDTAEAVPGAPAYDTLGKAFLVEWSRSKS